MEIVFASRHESSAQEWVAALQQALPEHQVRAWDDARQQQGQAEAAVVWAPLAASLNNRP